MEILVAENLHMHQKSLRNALTDAQVWRDHCCATGQLEDRDTLMRMISLMAQLEVEGAKLKPKDKDGNTAEPLSGSK